MGLHLEASSQQAQRLLFVSYRLLGLLFDPEE
jgi:hypothetical protein